MPDSSALRTMYCTGFWLIPGNRKRTAQHYLRLLPRTLSMISGGSLHLFCGDDDIERIFREAAGSSRVNLSVSRLSIAELPGATATPPILASAARAAAASRFEGARKKEKGDIHVRRDFLGSGPEVFEDLLSIWLSKPGLATRVAEDAGPAVERVAWIDASVAKFTGNRTNWDFPRHRGTSGKLSHYASPMRYRGDRLPLNASYLCAEKTLWPTVLERFNEQLDALGGDGYVHDEETIFAHVLERHPELSCAVGRPIRGIRGWPTKLLSRLPRLAPWKLGQNL